MSTRRPSAGAQNVPLDHWRRPHRQTPFHSRIEAAATTTDRYAWSGHVAFGTVTDSELEYFAIRSTCALFDVSPMVKYRITGRDALPYLQRLTLRDVSRLRIGRVHYTAWCDDAGKVLDDGTLFRLGEADFRLCCQERHLPWMLDSAIGFEVTIEEETDALAALSLQGPTSCALLQDAGFAGIESLPPFGIMPADPSGIAVTVSRTGFTGDLGYELFVASGDALALWDLLALHGERRGLRAVGYRAVDLARLEAGFLVAGVDFVPAEMALRADRARSPFEIGLGWMVDLAKGPFVGRRALVEEKRRDSFRHVLVGLEIDGNVPAEHAVVYHRKTREVGVTTSAAWSPTGKRNIALATLDRRYGERTVDDLWVEIYALRELRYVKLMVRARVVERPFVKLARRSATPPAAF